jgi:hypothetical protein
LAKKSTVNSNIFAKTEPVDRGPGPEEKHKKIPLGVALTPDEIAALDKIKEELGVVNRHALMQMIVRYFIDQFRAGNIKTESRTVVKKIIID